jgi:hypothetical protein
MAQEERHVYRNYALIASRQNLKWRVEVHPMSPELPILSKPTLSVRAAMKDEVLQAARERIDRLLAPA